MEFWKNLSASIKMVAAEVPSVMWFITGWWGEGFLLLVFLAWHNNIIFMSIMH
jgi:hypothetical protein